MTTPTTICSQLVTERTESSPAYLENRFLPYPSRGTPQRSGSILFASRSGNQINDSHQLIGLYGFCDKKLSPNHIFLLRRFFLRHHSRKEDYGNSLRLPATSKLSGNFRTGHSWHKNIEQDHVGSHLFSCLNRHRAVRTDGHLKLPGCLQVFFTPSEKSISSSMRRTFFISPSSKPAAK